MIVAKAGGGKGLDIEAVCHDVADLVHRGEQLVLVHGGSNETNVLSEKLGHPARFVTSVSGHVSRFTDRETLEIFAMAVAGRINTLLVERLQQLGVNALGISGIDGRLLVGERKDAIKVIEDGKRKVLRGDYSGQITGVNADLLRSLLNAGFVPVVAPLCLSTNGEALNVDGDRAAGEIAAALKAESLIILSNVPGLLRAFPDESTLIRHIPTAAVEDHINRYAQGRMKKKLLGAIEAIQGGVHRVVIADGRVAQPLQHALAGDGTVIN